MKSPTNPSHHHHLFFIFIFIFIFFLVFPLLLVNAENPYRYFTWEVTQGTIRPLGSRKQGILINGQFPGPDVYSVTNDNIIINVINYLKEPLLITWNGIQQRKDSWEDGVFGTTCPIPPGMNFTYHIQVKDQIGSFFYFPSLNLQRASGGFGGFRIFNRPDIPVPYPEPAADYTVLIGDWYNYNHKHLKDILDRGKVLYSPDGILINGRGPYGTSFRVEQGKAYRLRISNVGIVHSLNFRIQGHMMTLIEVEGTHTVQNTFSSLDVHVGQSYSVLVVADQPPQDYYIAVSTRFTTETLTTTAIFHYSDAEARLSGPIPSAPINDIDFSLFQARSIRTNLTASGPRPNPQGSYHYGSVAVTRNIVLENSAASINGRQRYGVNGVSYIQPDTPLKLADYFKIEGVFHLGSMPDYPNGDRMHLDTAVMAADHKSFAEIVFQNDEDLLQSWHLDGYNFFVVGMDMGKWTPDSRMQYNLIDAVARCTVQVYPHAWTAIYVPFDNVGMWNMRSEIWPRRYLGQQFYIRVYSPVESARDEYPIPRNALVCGRATGQIIR